MLLSRKLLFYQNQFPKEYFVPGSYSATLVPGAYEIILRGAGGAGGENGGNGAGTGGIGGAGSSGSLTRSILTVQNVTTALIYVGSKGVLSGTDYNGGNGGAGGAVGGKGGGAGKPSYVLINNVLYSADSGAGGGGGGGCGTKGRNADGGGGGGGGGRYKARQVTEYTAKRDIQLSIAMDENNNLFIREGHPDNTFSKITTGETLYVGKTWTFTYTDAYFNISDTYTIDSILQNGDIVLSCVRTYDSSTSYIGPSTITDVWSNTVIIMSVAGKKGSDFVNNGRGANGVTGNTAEFSNLYSGGGGDGYGWAGSNGAYGGGASGGSGGDAGNHSGDVHSGSGGGAAGGDNNAGGGTTGSIRAGGNGSNPHTTVTDTTSENALYGITGDYGTGGTTGTEGKNGFVVIRQLSVISETINLGNVNESVASIWNLGSITDSVTETKDCGNIT